MQKPISITVILSLLFVFLTLDQTQADEIIWKKDGAKMVLIPVGSFSMGSNVFADEQPIHTVHVDAFYMDAYEVTVGQYKQFVSATGHRSLPDWSSGYSPTDNHPVVGVSWGDAVAYATWAGKRLPTEAEWEYAARGGLSGKWYPWGYSDPGENQANFADKNVDQWLRDLGPDYTWADLSVDDSYQFTAPVGSFLANGYGLYDMAGNVWEWCSDWYDENYYGISPLKNPQGPGIGENRVLRG